MVESVKRVSKSEELAKARKRLKESEKELVESGASRVLAKINKDPAKKKTFEQMTTSQQAQYISNQFTLGNASAGQAWVSYTSDLNRCDSLEKEIQQGKANAQVKENASMRKTMVEDVKKVGKSEELAKARERLKEKEKELVSSGASRVLATINKDSAMKKTFEQMTTSQQAQYISKQFTLGNASAGQAWASYKSALNRCDRLEKEIQQGKANAQVKEDSSRGNEAKKQVRRKKMTYRPRPIPKKVMEAAKEQQAHSTYLEDSIHNRIYLIRSGNEPKARTLSLMLERNGEQVSETIPMNSTVMKLLNQARSQDKTNSDFGEIMKALNAEREVELPNVLSEGKVIGKKLEIKKVDLMQDMTIKEAKLKITPTVTLVPKIKKNGEPSKKNFNIRLTDADGKVFILDKKMMEKAIKQQGNASATRGEMVDFSWNNYVEAAKEGKLSPETVASFFKGQVNLGVEETTKDNKSPNLALMAQRER